VGGGRRRGVGEGRRGRGRKKKNSAFYGIQIFITVLTAVQHVFFLVLNQRNAVHGFSSCFFKIHFNTAFPSTTESCKQSLSFGLFNQNAACVASHAFHIARNVIIVMFIVTYKS
jgi:hypothetical protein